VRVPVPCVLSVEGSVASLRRAGLRAALAARTAAITVVPFPSTGHAAEPVTVAPFRPRARVLPAPAGDDVLARLRALTDTGGEVTHGESLVLDPPAAAARIVTALREWGYLAD
jgi:electron transfer flavoprotein beta subunit